MKTIEGIYDQFNFTAFDSNTSNSLYPKILQKECNALATYRRNQYQSVILDDKLKATIQNRWANQFERLHYNK